MELLKTIAKDRRFHRLALGGIVVGVGVMLAAWRLGVDGAVLKGWWKATEDFLRGHPWWLFAGLVVLPAFPVPTSALLILAGTVWRSQPVVACAICVAAMALNMSWSYWLAARPARRLVEKWLENSTLRLPEVPRDNHLRMLLLLRLTPGIPFFLQNYLLGFFGTPFRLYLPVSLGCNSLFLVGFVLSGAGIAGGNLKPLMTGLGLIVVAVVGVQMMRKRLQG